MSEVETVAVGDLDRILGRPAHDMQIDVPLTHLIGKRVLVTGAAGSIGQALVPLLRDCTVWATDLNELDVTAGGDMLLAFDSFRPDVVFHLAGAKHAPAGEEDPWSAMLVNAIGTRHVLAAAGAIDAGDCVRVVTASTCKACNPETAYGASKLIAERMTLNAGHSVARFYNVVETQGNVFDIWWQIPDDQPIPWTDCYRYFITLREAVGLILWSAILPPARYTVEPGTQRWMGDVAADAYPHRLLEQVPARRGDRQTEPMRGSHEHMVPVRTISPLWRVVSPHD
jgi:FlaA1/EpsC-like NDP-sugar epimerase